MVTMDAGRIDISEISGISSGATYSFVTDGSREAKEHMLHLLEMLEDEEDVKEGLKALADAEGTCSCEEYQHRRKG